MSKEQIEKIAKVIARRSADFRNRNVAFMTTAQKTATEIYHKFCNKQSEGEWVDQYNGKYDNPIYVCSVCRRGTLLKPYIDNLGNMKTEQALSEFCPRCGARMKGGAE